MRNLPASPCSPCGSFGKLIHAWKVKTNPPRVQFRYYFALYKPKEAVYTCNAIHTLRTQVPNIQVLEMWVIVIIVQVLGKYMIIRYLDPQGHLLGCACPPAFPCSWLRVAIVPLK